MDQKLYTEVLAGRRRTLMHIRRADSASTLTRWQHLCDVISESRLRKSMCIYLKNNPLNLISIRFETTEP